MTPDQLPKVELHLHLDCGLSFEVVSQIDPSITNEAWRNGYVAPAKCENLADFLIRAVKGVALMQTKEQLQLVVKDLFKQLFINNVLYAEIRFAPLQHLLKGLSAYEAVEITEAAVAAAIAETQIEARLILCTLRHFTEAQSMETAKLAVQFKGTTVAGFDIAANEAGFPLDNHIGAFKYAKEKGICCTAHAGEARGSESVWETLQYLAPARIGHGVRSIEDPKLVDYLRSQRIHLEICPSCNVQTGMYYDYAHHPVDRLYKAGVSLSISTDAPTIVDITLTKEYKKLQENFGWTIRDFYTCNAYALEAAFIPQALKTKLMNKLKMGYGVL